MNENDDLDPELKSLLRADADAAPDSAKARVATALAASVPLFGTGTAVAHLSKHTFSATRAYAMAASAFVVGAAVGAAGLAAIRPAATALHHGDAVAPSDAGEIVEGPIEQVTIPSAPHPELPVVAPTDAADATVVTGNAHSDISTSATDVAAERALLDDARGALNQGDAAEALRILEHHRARFPRGQLGEERDAMAISALVKANRRDEAEKRAAIFRTRSPKSLFLPMIDAALRTP